MGEYAEMHTLALAKVLSSDNPESLFYTTYSEVLNNI